MRASIGIKIFGIAIGLLLLMGAAALLSLRMTRTVDDQLKVLDTNYFPAYAALSDADVRAAEESAFIRRLMLAFAEDPRDEGKIADLQSRAIAAGQDCDASLAKTRSHVNAQIADPLSFDDNVALGRLDERLAFLLEERHKDEALRTELLDAARNRQPKAAEILAEIDEVRDDLDRRISAAEDEMRKLADGAIDGTRSYQRTVTRLSLSLLVIAGLLGLTLAALVTIGLVRPVRRLLAGTAAVEGGALDTVVPVTSRDEIGHLTTAFNAMVEELRIKARIRDTFGKYVDPRIVAGLIDRPDLADPRGARREMTILFCDMQGFTSLSEGLTPEALVTVLNRYFTVLAEPVRRNSGIIDKYIGDAVMAFWGPPFTTADDHARLACFAAIEQFAALPGLQAELPELTGVRRGLPTVRVRIGIATGEVVVGNLGSELSRNYTVIGDTVNLASRIEGASKAYGTRILISERTQQLAGSAIEVREIDSVLVLGKSEPERLFELLGRKGEVAADRLELRDTFAAALSHYREQNWERAAQGFRDCLSIIPDDPPSNVFIRRIERFRATPPEPGWRGIWALEAK